MDPLRAALLCLCCLRCAVTAAAAAAAAQASAHSSALRYSVREEEPPGTLVGNLARDLGLTPAQLHARGFRALQGTNASDYLVVSADSGEVRVRGRLDREAVCPRAAGDSGCALLLEAVLDRPTELARVHVDVLDVNDHAPRFPAESALLEITESAAAGTRFLLEGARDPDAGANALRRYAMEPDDGAFALDVQPAGGGGGGAARAPVLVVRRALDRERQAVHTYVLTALDGGHPPLTGTTLLTVRVLDSNDNAPTFDRPVYQARVPENAPVGTPVVQLNASDPDEGANGEVVYALGAHVAPRVRDLFAVDSRSGRVTLKGALDYEEANAYEIYVQARDRGPNSIPVHGEVLVRILDVNDNAPDVQVLILGQGAGGGAGGAGGAGGGAGGAAVISVSEGVPPGAFVAFVRVKDRDSGANGRVSCTLEGASAVGPGAALPFALRASDGGEDYTLVTATQLDREAAAEYNLTVVARDNGVPPLVSVKTFAVRVTDENDNAPRFSRSAYELHVPENNIPGAYIGSVSASDSDAQQNAQVAYSIVDSQIDGMSVFTYVSINPASGALYALRAFDHEHARRLEFRVQARDNGAPPLRGEAAVALVIGDVNDNAPVVVAPPLDANGTADVYVAPGARAGTLVTQVRASDDDGAGGAGGGGGDDGDGDGNENARLSYSIARGNDRGLFRIDASNGDVRTARALPYEHARHELAIAVRDGGEPAFTATATVRVLVTDARPEGRLLGSSGDDVGGGGGGAGGGGGGAGGADGAFTTSFIVIVALGAVSCVLLVAMVMIALRCKRENKEMRTYNCRAAAESSAQPSPRKNDVTLVRNELEAAACSKAGSDADLASVIALHTYEYQSFLPSETAGGTRGSGDARGDDAAMYRKAPAPAYGSSAAPAPRKPLPCHALNGVSGQPDLLLGGFAQPAAQRSRFFLEPNNHFNRQQQQQQQQQQQSSRSLSCKEADRLSFKDSGHGDSDPGDSDQDTTRGSYSEVAAKETVPLQPQRGCTDDGAAAAAAAGPREEQGDGDVHSNCTPECKVLGHSDRCWMPAFNGAEGRPGGGGACHEGVYVAVTTGDAPAGGPHRDFPRRTFSTFGKDDSDGAPTPSPGATSRPYLSFASPAANAPGSSAERPPVPGSRPNTLRLDSAPYAAGAAAKSPPRHPNADRNGNNGNSGGGSKSTTTPSDGSDGSASMACQECAGPSVPNNVAPAPLNNAHLAPTSLPFSARRLAPIPEPSSAELEEADAEPAMLASWERHGTRGEGLDATQVVAEIEQLLRDSAS
uniref:Protocadherin-10 isoform X2 n=1 Tax=Petromyzon marinus TaxID=7757 RepID=A0AAJ7WUS4_PETMA|nr:protocadherin-10 isoform X2 [Petromyzon marinus]